MTSSEVHNTIDFLKKQTNSRPYSTLVKKKHTHTHMDPLRHNYIASVIPEENAPHCRYQAQDAELMLKKQSFQHEKTSQYNPSEPRNRSFTSSGHISVIHVKRTRRSASNKQKPHIQTYKVTVRQLHESPLSYAPPDFIHPQH